MCSLITEKEILQFDFTPAKNNNTRFWQNKVEEMINEGKNEEEINISFTANSNSYRVKAKISSVIENYIKTENGVVIPISSVNKIYPDMPPKIVVQENIEPLLKALLVIFISLIVVLLLLYAFIK